MIKIEQDGFYLNAMGEIICIKEVMGEYFDGNLNLYLADGTFEDGGRQMYDLIAYIPKELHYRLLNMIKSYHKNESVKSFIDIEFKKDTK